MEKYLIFMDIDGTLVDDNQHIFDRTVTTIQNLQKKGNIFYIATGRSLPQRKSLPKPSIIR